MSEKKSEKKSKIPYIFVAFFLVVASVNIFYIYLSKKTWRGVSEENGYQKGLQFNDVIKSAEKQKALGWKMIINFSPAYNASGSKAYNLQILLNGKASPIKDAQIYVNFKRPVQEGMDFVVNPIFSAKDSAYLAQVIFPVSGQWDAEFTAMKGSDEFREKKRIVVK